MDLSCDVAHVCNVEWGTFLAGTGRRRNPTPAVQQRKSPERPIQAGDKRRTFTDREGTFWDVREVRNPEYDRRGGTSLVFESSNAIRRVRNFPDNWMRLSEADLDALSRAT
jgi:hypothetical protein